METRKTPTPFLKNSSLFYIVVQLTPKTVGDTHTTFTPPRFFPIFPFYLFKGKRRRYLIFFHQPYTAELYTNLSNVVTLAMWKAFFPLPQIPGGSGYTTVKRLFGGNQNLDFLWFHPDLILLRETYCIIWNHHNQQQQRKNSAAARTC